MESTGRNEIYNIISARHLSPTRRIDRIDKSSVKSITNHLANVKDIANVVEYVRNVDAGQFAIIRDKVFEVLEEVNIVFEEIMNQNFDEEEEMLSNDTGYVSDLSVHDTDHAEKFVPSPEIRALNSRIKHCMI